MQVARLIVTLTCTALVVAGASAQTNAFAAPEGKRVDILANSHAILEANPDIEYDPTTVLVRFAPEASDDVKQAARLLLGVETVRRYSIVPGLEQVTVVGSVEQTIQLLKSLPFVEYAEPDYIVRNCVTPNDTYFNRLWGLHNTGQTVNGDPGIADADIDAAEAWNVFTGNASFTIAIIDTGVQSGHPDLNANIWANPGEVAGNGVDDDGNGYIDDVKGWDFYNNDNNPADDNGHGTHTAGTVGGVGNNGLGVAGVNWRCKLVGCKFLNSGGSGSTTDAIEAVQYCTGKGIKVSNNSWGGGGFSQGLYDAINAAKSVGHIFCAAAGNSNNNNDLNPFYPASYNLDNLIAVAATDNNDAKASFSSYGATSVDIGAPGVTIYSTYTGSSYAYLNGTSMATPHVTGVVGLVYGRNPTWTYQQVRSQVLSTARPISALSGRCVTGGVVNAQAAVGSGPVNTPPVVTITSPANGTSVTQGTVLTFSATATDTQDGNVAASLVWTSNTQGQFGTGPSFNYSNLNIGTHTVTATATDSGFLTGSASITVTILASGTPPAAPTITSAENLGLGRAAIYWIDNSTDESGFEVQRQKNVGGLWTNTTIAKTTGPNIVNVVDQPGAGLFRYRVRAFNPAGSSAWTSWRSVTITNP